MNPISILAQLIREHYPQWKLTEDLAAQPNGSSFLDIEAEGRTAIVEWRPGKGFGISSGPFEGFGLGPDEVYASQSAVLARLEDVVLKGLNTVPLREISLKRLREVRRITQEEIAKVLAITQASVSKIESRSDIRLSTLYKFIEAMGGKLELIARFPEFEVMVNPFADSKQGDHSEVAT